MLKTHAADIIAKIEEGFDLCIDLNGNIMLQLGQTFDNVTQFRNVLKVCTIKKGFKLERVKNEKVRVTYKYAASNYKWRIHASPAQDKLSFQIKTLMLNHTISKDN